MLFFEPLKCSSIFECYDDVEVWYQMKAYMCANMKTKKTWKQSIQTYKSHMISADPMYVFSENGCTYTA